MTGVLDSNASVNYGIYETDILSIKSKMTETQQIVEYAGSLFDVVGVSRCSATESFLILGLESTPERDLDDFERLEGQLQLSGFEKHVQPRLESLLNFMQARGLSAEPLGRYGYPRRGEVNLKDKAISAGLGKRGKSTIVLHPEYGTRLRFAVIRIAALLESTTSSPLPETENPFCDGCSVCIDACPVRALEPYRMPDASICLANSRLMTEQSGRLILCDICLSVCTVEGRRI